MMKSSVTFGGESVPADEVEEEKGTRLVIDWDSPNIMETVLAEPFHVQRGSTSSQIWVTFQKEGFHNYPGAPDEVAFLRDRHRHIFHFRVQIAVFHDDRDIEFILFKRELEGLFDSGAMEINHKSCEMLARDLIEYIHEKYSGRYIEVSVSEDGENGAVVQFFPVR